MYFLLGLKVGKEESPTVDLGKYMVSIVSTMSPNCAISDMADSCIIHARRHQSHKQLLYYKHSKVVFILK